MKFDEILDMADRFNPGTIFDVRRVDGVLFHIETIPQHRSKTVFVYTDDNGLEPPVDGDFVSIRAEDDVTLKILQKALDNLNSKRRHLGREELHPHPLQDDFEK